MSRPTHELLTPDYAEHLGNEMFYAAGKEVFRLGRSGAVRLPDRNQYKDVSIRVDPSTEQAMADVAANSNIPLLIKGEELGTFTVNVPKGKSWKGVLVLDGEDGSNAAEKFLLGSTDRLHLRWGSMSALAFTRFPRYNQFVWSGISEQVYQGEEGDVKPFDQLTHENTGRVIFATKGKGTFSKIPGEESRQLFVPKLTRAESTFGPHIAANYLELNYWDSFDHQPFEEHANATGLILVKSLSTGSMVADLLSGARVPDYALVQNSRDISARADERPRYGNIFRSGERPPIVLYVDPTRKGHEELAATVLMALEAGAVARTLFEGKPADVGERSFLTWKQDWNKRRTKRSEVVAIGVNRNIADTAILASHGMLRSQRQLAS